MQLIMLYNNLYVSFYTTKRNTLNFYCNLLVYTDHLLGVYHYEHLGILYLSIIILIAIF